MKTMWKDREALQLEQFTGQGADLKSRFPARNLTSAAAKRKLTVNESLANINKSGQLFTQPMAEERKKARPATSGGVGAN